MERVRLQEGMDVCMSPCLQRMRSINISFWILQATVKMKVLRERMILYEGSGDRG